METKVRYHDCRAHRKKDVKLCCQCCAAIRTAILSHAVMTSRFSGMLCSLMQTHSKCKEQIFKCPPSLSMKAATSTDIWSPWLCHSLFHKPDAADDQRNASRPHGQQKKPARPNNWLGTTHRLQVNGAYLPTCGLRCHQISFSRR